MAYPSVTNTFVESTTAYASAVNQNFLDVINGVSDGTKDIRVNDATIQGNMSLSNALISRTILPAAADTYGLGSAAGSWNNIYVNQATIETMAVSSTGRVQFRANTNYLSSDSANYLDLHAGNEIRANQSMQIVGSFSVAGSATVNQELTVVGSAAVSAIGVAGTATAGHLSVSGSATVGQTMTVTDIFPAIAASYTIGDVTTRMLGVYSTNLYAHTELRVGNNWGPKIRFYTANEYINSPSAGRVDIYADNGSGVVVIGAASVYVGATLPATDSACDLGGAFNRWKDLYVKGTAYVSGPVECGGSIIFSYNGKHAISGGDSALNIYASNAITISMPVAGQMSVVGGGFQTTGNTVVLNSGKGSYDLDVHGNSTTDVLCVKGSAGQVGILKSTPSQALDVAGTIVGTDIGFRGCTENLASYASGSFDAYYTGLSSAATLTFKFVSVGKHCTLYMPALAGKTSTAATFSLPVAQMPAGAVPAAYSGSDRPIVFYANSQVFDDSAASCPGGVMVNGSEGILFTKGVNDLGWTASGQKNLNANLTITYIKA